MNIALIILHFTILVLLVLQYLPVISANGGSDNMVLILEAKRLDYMAYKYDQLN